MKCTGVNTAAQLAATFHGRFRVLLIEKNSHFQHLFAFPRFAVVTGVDTHKAFIPYNPGAFANCPPGSGTYVQARVTGLNASAVQLDREVLLDGQKSNIIPYAFVVSETHFPLKAQSLILCRSLLPVLSLLHRRAYLDQKSLTVLAIYRNMHKR